MADQIKEISNGTYGIGALSNGVPIASTDADTQYVVKDIQVQNNQLTAVSAPLNFNVNNITVASLSSSVTGSEIIDVSSTAIAVATASFANEIIGFFGSTSGTGGKATSLSTRKVNGVQTYAASTQSAAITTALTQASNIAGQWFIGSDFFYLYDDGNSQQILYRRVGGINGTESIVFGTSYATVVFNGVDRFHQVDTSVIRTYVPATNTTTSVTIQNGAGWPGSLSSYPRISYANGLVFWQYNADYVVWAINPTTGYNTRVYGVTPGATSSSYTPLEVYYNSGNYYFLNTTNSSTSGTIYIGRVSDFGPLTSASISSVTGSVIYYTPSPVVTAGIPISQLWPKLNRSSGDWFWYKSVTSNIFTFGCFNMLTQTIKPDLVVNTNLYPPSISSNSYFALSSVTSTDDSANKLNTTFYPQTATLRVTGVETTL